MWQAALDIFRTITALLVLVGLVLTVRNRVKYRGFWNYQESFFIRGSIFMMLAPLVGLPWNIVHHAPVNIGLPFVTIGAVMLIYAGLTKPERLMAAEKYVEMQERREHPDPD